MVPYPVWSGKSNLLLNRSFEVRGSGLSAGWPASGGVLGLFERRGGGGLLHGLGACAPLPVRGGRWGGGVGLGLGVGGVRAGEVETYCAPPSL